MKDLRDLVRPNILALEPAKARTGPREHWDTGWVVREGSAF